MTVPPDYLVNRQYKHEPLTATLCVMLIIGKRRKGGIATGGKERVDYNEMTIAQLEGQLKPLERAFVEHYDQCGNGTEAAIRAGYDPDNRNAAAVAASRMLRRDKIVAYRRARAKELYERLGLSKETLAMHLDEVLRRAMTAIPHMKYDRASGGYKPDGTWEFDGRTATRALELMGNLIGAYEHKVTGNVTVAGLEEYLSTLDGGDTGGGLASESTGAHAGDSAATDTSDGDPFADG